MNDAELQAIRERLSAATPGPWKTFESNAIYAPSVGLIAETVSGDIPCDEANADLIVHAPRDIRALLAEVERLRNAVEAEGEKTIAMVDAVIRKAVENERETCARIVDGLAKLSVEVMRTDAAEALHIAASGIRARGTENNDGNR